MFGSTQKRLHVEGQGKFAIAWTGQAGFAIKDASGSVYHIDPYLSEACFESIGYRRLVPPPVEAKDVQADVFLFTHEHRDHLDPVSVPVMARNNPHALFAGPPACLTRLLQMGVEPHRLVAMERNNSKQIGTSTVHAVMAHHTADSVGYVLQFAGASVYITGDTTYGDDLIAIANLQPDLMLSCINGRLGCMNIADAVRLTAHIQPRFAVPMHIGMFIENTASGEEFVRQVEASSGLTKGFLMELGVWYMFEPDEGFTKIA